MRGIASRWGVKPAALYHWFPSKAKLLEAICHYGIGEFVQQLEAVVELDAPTQERVRRAIRVHLEPLLEQRFYVHAFLFQRRDLPRRARRPLDAQSHAYEALWRRLLEEGRREGTISASLDIAVAVPALLGMCNSVARWPRNGVELSVERVANAMSGLICQGLFEPRAVHSNQRRSTP